ncbi:hypothetical protein THASP1DRAFT_15235 [Thamnocephalis sphaerospora]|uniref:Uncharacterized protein n=1 Tax=Thamnocephalis sphaerospora TaxID=78915 RepID=A0A4P9XRL3_9FUNG|nr:hypothetical protein THASP1DRAFT_15235 [Thamnocephalis sphaerospora]|eukprot:RKP08733.1 hypothetical protein THASP1DRAFT_15235 [Thamnocephalis sphaerospora]
MLGTKIILTYHLVFITAQIFQLILCADAVFRQDTIQIIGLAVFNFMLLGYSAVQLSQTGEALNSSTKGLGLAADQIDGLHTSKGCEIAIIVILAFFSFTFAFQAWHLFQEFGWRIYKKIGADLNMRRMYQVHQVFVTVLKFDVFLFIAFAAQFWSVLNEAKDTNAVIVHSIVSVGGSVLMLAIGFWATYNESSVGIGAFVLGVLGTMGYLVYRMVALYAPAYVKRGAECTPGMEPKDCDRFLGSRIFLTFFIAATLIMGLITLAITYRVYRNFGKGLRYRCKSWHGRCNV